MVCKFKSQPCWMVSTKFRNQHIYIFFAENKRKNLMVKIKLNNVKLDILQIPVMKLHWFPETFGNVLVNPNYQSTICSYIK